MRINFKTGFTLIELLVVTAIISVLAGIALSQFENYRKQAYHAEARLQVSAARTGIGAFRASSNSNLGVNIHVARGVYSTGTASDLPGFIPGREVVISAYYYPPDHPLVAMRGLEAAYSQHCRGPLPKAWGYDSATNSGIHEEASWTFSPGC